MSNLLSFYQLLGADVEFREFYEDNVNRIKLPSDINITKYVAGSVVVFDLKKLEIEWIANIIYLIISLFLSLIYTTFRSYCGYWCLSCVHVCWYVEILVTLLGGVVVIVLIITF